MLEIKKEIGKKNIILIVLFLSILIHILLLLIIFKYEYPNKILINNKPIDKKKDNLIQYKKIDFPKTVKTQTQAEPSNLPNVRGKKGIPIFSEEKKLIPKIQDNSMQQVIQSIKKDIEIDKVKKNINKKIEANNISKKIKISSEINEIKNDLNQIKEDMQHTLNSNDSTTKSLKAKSIKAILNDENKPILPQSFMQGLLKGFEDGEHLFTCFSSDNMAGGDFKLVSFLDKIFANIFNAWNIRQCKFNIKGQVIFYFGMRLILNKKGDIISLEKTRSTGNNYVDDFIMETIKYGAPYPPIPEHLNKDEFLFSQTFIIESIKHR